ncbi:hypothetical protein Tco_0434354 [Tanacetum coccineum]
MASMNTRLNIKKLDGNIVQKHGGSKQVGFKQLGHGVEIGVHGVHDENVFGLRWNCRELKGIVKLRFFRLVTMILQWLKDGWRTSNLKGRQTRTAWSIQQCMKSGVAKHLGVAGIQQQNELVDKTSVTLFAKVRCFLIQSGGPRFEVSARGKDAEYRLCLSVTPKVEIPVRYYEIKL